jgi:hypothetical protein
MVLELTISFWVALAILDKTVMTEVTVELGPLVLDAYVLH